MATEPDPNAPFADYALHAARLLDLPLADEHRPGVAANLALLAGLAGSLAAFPLPAATPPAPVFEP